MSQQNHYPRRKPVVRPAVDDRFDLIGVPEATFRENSPYFTCAEFERTVARIVDEVCSAVSDLAAPVSVTPGRQ